METLNVEHIMKTVVWYFHTLNISQNIDSFGLFTVSKQMKVITFILNLIDTNKKVYGDP